jgi:Tfp pilus assembly protein PilN
MRLFERCNVYTESSELCATSSMIHKSRLQLLLAVVAVVVCLHILARVNCLVIPNISNDVSSIALLSNNTQLMCDVFR